MQAEMDIILHSTQFMPVKNNFHHLFFAKGLGYINNSLHGNRKRNNRSLMLYCMP